MLIRSNYHSTTDPCTYSLFGISPIRDRRERGAKGRKVEGEVTTVYVLFAVSPTRDGRETGAKGRKVEGVVLPRLSGKLSHVHSSPDTLVVRVDNSRFTHTATSTVSHARERNTRKRTEHGK